MQKKNCAVYKEGAVTDQMCQKWFAKFRDGDFLLEDSPWLGRWVEVDSDQIKTLIEINQCYTTWERTDILKVSKSIKLLVKMKTVSFILQKKKTKQIFWPTFFEVCSASIAEVHIKKSYAFYLVDYKTNKKAGNIKWLLKQLMQS